MLVMNLETGIENHFDENTAPEYALAYSQAFQEGLMADFWDIDKESLYKALPFRHSHRLGRDILYLGDWGTVIN